MTSELPPLRDVIARHRIGARHGLGSDLAEAIDAIRSGVAKLIMEAAGT